MDFAFHQLCPEYYESLAPTASTAIRLWETFTFIIIVIIIIVIDRKALCFMVRGYLQW